MRQMKRKIADDITKSNQMGGSALDKCILPLYTRVNKIIYKKTINSPITKSNRVEVGTFCNM